MVVPNIQLGRIGNVRRYSNGNVKRELHGVYNKVMASGIVSEEEEGGAGEHSESNYKTRMSGTTNYDRDRRIETV